MFRLDARHENQLNSGFQGVTTLAAGEPAQSPLARIRAARWLQGLVPRAAQAFGLAVCLTFGSPAHADRVRPAPAGVENAARLDHQALRTLQRIRAGGPFPYAKDGIVFGNYEHQLPAAPRGYYREYTVPTPGSRNRGPRRIVCGGAPRSPDVCYYTHDHYASFQFIAR